MATTGRKVEERDAKARAQKLHKESVFINALDSTWFPGFSDTYVANLRASGITSSNVTVNYVPWSDSAEAMRSFHAFWALARRLSNDVMIATTVDDILRAKAQGKTALILGFQSPKPIDDYLGLLEMFYQLGLRISGLSYQRRSYLANGCGEDRDDGLSKLGREVVREMNRLGIVIDLSHLGDTSAAEAIEVSAHPVIFSHSNARSVCNHFRNATDEHIRALAAKGGVIGIGALSQFLRPDGPVTGTTFEDSVNHIDYVVQLVGVDHVGIGLDAAPESRRSSDLQAMDSMYPEFGFTKAGPMENRYAFQRITEIAQLTETLVRRGYSDDDIRKILGGNMLRVFRTVWKERNPGLH